MAKERNLTRGPLIRSGGQTGVDRAALDAAVLTGRPYEGWCPKGGWAEDFLRPPGLLTYIPILWRPQPSLPNNEPSGMYATVRPRSYLSRTQNIAHYLDRGAIMGLKNMISQLGGAQSLNFAGPRESEHLGAYDLCLAIFIEGLASYCGKNSDPKPTN